MGSFVVHRTGLDHSMGVTVPAVVSTHCAPPVGEGTTVFDSNCQKSAGSTTMFSTTLDSNPPRMTIAIGV